MQYYFYQVVCLVPITQGFCVVLFERLWWIWKAMLKPLDLQTWMNMDAQIQIVRAEMQTFWTH